MVKNPPIVLSEADRGLLSHVAFDVEGLRNRLEASGGGREIAHASPGLELSACVLVPPGPGRQLVQPHDQIYVVLGGWGIVSVEGNIAALERGEGLFVPAGARHAFVTYEQLSLLVISTPRWGIEPIAPGWSAAP